MATKAAALQAWLEQHPESVVDATVETGVITAGSLTIQGHMPTGMRDAFVTDKWNPTSMLLADFERVRSTVQELLLEVDRIVRPSPEEEICHLSMDWYRL